MVLTRDHSPEHSHLAKPRETGLLSIDPRPHPQEREEVGKGDQGGRTMGRQIETLREVAREKRRMF